MLWEWTHTHTHTYKFALVFVRGAAAFVLGCISHCADSIGSFVNVWEIVYVLYAVSHSTNTASGHGLWNAGHNRTRMLCTMYICMYTWACACVGERMIDINVCNSTSLSYIEHTHTLVQRMSCCLGRVSRFIAILVYVKITICLYSFFLNCSHRA